MHRIIELYFYSPIILAVGLQAFFILYLCALLRWKQRTCLCAASSEAGHKNAISIEGSRKK